MDSGGPQGGNSSRVARYLREFLPADVLVLSQLSGEVQCCAFLIAEQRTGLPNEAGEGQRHPGAAHAQRAATFSGCSEHGIGVERGDKRVKVAVAGGSLKRVDDLPLGAEISIGNWSGTAHVPAGAARQLAGRAKRRHADVTTDMAAR
jgi:hypothetical protein